MRFGLSEETIKAITDAFAQFPEIEKAVLYGSRAKGNFKNGSDIDICLFGSIDLPLLQKIETKIDDLLLPYIVDLAVYSNIRNQDLIDHIERVGILFK